MQSCEILIVGAGPAGATCAKILSKWGLPVILMDRERFPRDKPCAGWITPAVLELLRIDPLEYRKGRLLQEIREFRTGIMFGSEKLIRYGETVSYGITRSEFDSYLLAQNTSPMLLGEPVKALERVAEGWLVNGRIRARLLVGAGGHTCPVARILGARPGREPAIVAMVAEHRMEERELADCPLEPGYTALSFTGDGKGYGWVLRKGPFLNVGLGCLGGSDVRRRLTDFCQHLRERGVLKGEQPARFRGHAYLPYRNHGGRRIVGDRVLVIGDAAGLAFPESGEGILPAVESAVMAAQTILCAMGDYRPRWLEPYAEEIVARFGRKGNEVKLPPGMKELGARVLLSSDWLTRRLVLDRWFLHRDLRPLVPRSDEGCPFPPSDH